MKFQHNPDVLLLCKKTKYSSIKLFLITMFVSGPGQPNMSDEQKELRVVLERVPPSKGSLVSVLVFVCIKQKALVVYFQTADLWSIASQH
jgi:hypothetical protein